MNKEIELKAHVDEPDLLKDRLSGIYGSPVLINKNDIYYLYDTDKQSGKGQPVRLRTENGVNTVTVKRKSVSNGIEINDELEFNVDNGENFIKFLQLTGAGKWVDKSKHGWKFTADVGAGKAVIELCEVSRLGWFIEIEIVVESPDDKLIATAQEQILDILKIAGISREKIEQRYYSDMLLENNCL